MILCLLWIVLNRIIVTLTCESVVGLRPRPEGSRRGLQTSQDPPMYRSWSCNSRSLREFSTSFFNRTFMTSHIPSPLLDKYGINSFHYIISEVLRLSSSGGKIKMKVRFNLRGNFLWLKQCKLKGVYNFLLP